MSKLLREELNRVKQMMMYNVPGNSEYINREKEYIQTKQKPTSIKEFRDIGETVIKEEVEPEIKRGMRVQRKEDGKTGHLSDVVWNNQYDKIYHVKIKFDDGTDTTVNYGLFKTRYDY